MTDHHPVTREANDRSRRRRQIDLVIYALLAAAVFIPVTAVLVRQQSQVVPQEQWQSELDSRGQIRPLAEVIELTRQLKLVTVEVISKVSATMTDRRWRGTASATVTAPARYHYGVDLVELEQGALRYDYLSQSYVLNLPAPQILSIEVDGGHPVEEIIEVTGTRFKKLSGQEQLNLAQKAIYDEAWKQVLPRDQREDVRQATRHQVAQMVETILGQDARVKVRFNDE